MDAVVERLGGLRVLMVVLCLVATSTTTEAKEWLYLKNGMNSRVVVLIKAEQQRAPTQVYIQADSTYKFPLDFAGPYTLQVIPDDQKDSGYHLGTLNLRLLAKLLGNSPCC